MGKLSDDILAFAKKAEAKMEIDRQTGIGKDTTDNSLFESLMEGEDVNMGDVERVDNYRTKFVAGVTYAYGQVANRLAAEDPAFSTATIELKAGHKDNLTINWDRQRTYPNRLAGDGAEVTKHGVTSITLETRAGKNAGALKSVRELISSQMEELAKS